MNQDIIHAQKMREQLFAQLPTESAIILYSAREKTRNNDVHYPYRQDSYFYYLTAFPEANAIAVLEKNKTGNHYTLYSAPKNPLQELWEGEIIGQENAKMHYLADNAYPIAEALQRIPQQLQNIKQLYTLLGYKNEDDEQSLKILRQAHQLAGRGGLNINGIYDLRRILDEMRLIKTPYEQQQLQKAAHITAQGILSALKALPKARYEYELQAQIECHYKQQNSSTSFPTIVAAGENACCLHYRSGKSALKKGELVLIDTGAEYENYAGDISRTLPISGKFSREQQCLYEIILHAQKSAIAYAKAGITHLELHQYTTRLLMEGLKAHKIIDCDIEELLETGQSKRYYPHGTGHWLGLDVHDVGTYFLNGESRTYQEGMIITIEPGLYLQKNDLSIAEKWRGIGIRIEDTVCITKENAIVLSEEIPKEIKEIESLIKKYSH